MGLHGRAFPWGLACLVVEELCRDTSASPVYGALHFTAFGVQGEGYGLAA